MDLQRRGEDRVVRDEIRRLPLERAYSGILERLRHRLEGLVVDEDVHERPVVGAIARREVEGGLRHRGAPQGLLEESYMRILMLLDLLEDGDVARGNEPTRSDGGVVEGRLQELERQREVQDV